MRRAGVRWMLGRKSAGRSGIPDAIRILLNPKLLLRIGAEAFGSPHRTPHHIHSAVCDTGQLFDSRFHLSADVDMLRAPLGSEGHVNGNVLLGIVGVLDWRGRKIYFVDQAQVDDVYRNLRIVTTLQRA